MYAKGAWFTGVDSEKENSGTASTVHNSSFHQVFTTDNSVSNQQACEPITPKALSSTLYIHPLRDMSTSYIYPRFLLLLLLQTTRTSKANAADILVFATSALPELSR